MKSSAELEFRLTFQPKLPRPQRAQKQHAGAFLLDKWRCWCVSGQGMVHCLSPSVGDQTEGLVHDRPALQR